MVRTNDQFWDYVEETEDGLKCTFCKRKYAAGISITRVKYHLSGVPRGGIRICKNVTTDVQQAAYQALLVTDKKHKTMEGSSSRELINTTSTCPQEQGNDIENFVGDAGGIPMEVEGVLEQEMGGEGISLHVEATNDRGMTTEGTVRPTDISTSPGRYAVDAHETREEALEETDLVNQALTTSSWKEMYEHLMGVDAENMTTGLVQPDARASSSGGLMQNVSETRGEKFLTTKLVGREFEKKKDVIWSWLMNDEVSSIGVYGMGGVGKTTLLKHINNLLLERPNPFHHVWWITVSHDCSIYKLQHLVANRVGLDLSKEDDEMYRAAKLSKVLIEKQQCVLILDDLWNQFRLEQVGIPEGVNGCKLILTTRSLDTCRRMGCRKKIEVELLSEEEAWMLFMEKLGYGVPLSSEVEQIAKSVVSECAGLPLGLITMAMTMREVGNACEWRNALNELKGSKVRQDDMEPEVFRILRFSYSRLNDLAVQQCFLYCALFPEDLGIYREKLIGYLIDEGIIEGMESRKAEFDRGHAMLNKLANACLLECCEDYSRNSNVRMHDLIKDMALQIQQAGNSRVMVDAGTHLKELPDVEKWTEDLVRVSLTNSHLEEIPSTQAIRCPNLSTLLLFDNCRLRFIADAFFQQLHGLKVLDLSNTNIEILPKSTSDLTNLRSLLLSMCVFLRHVPALTKLRMLRRLDLSYTGLKKVPLGIESLSNLRYLNVYGSKLKVFPAGILPKLSCLQVLITEKITEQKHDDLKPEGAPVKVDIVELACLKKLELYNSNSKVLRRGRSDSGRKYVALESNSVLEYITWSSSSNEAIRGVEI